MKDSSSYYTSEQMTLASVLVALFSLLIGFFAGFFTSKRCAKNNYTSCGHHYLETQQKINKWVLFFGFSFEFLEWGMTWQFFLFRGRSPRDSWIKRKITTLKLGEFKKIPFVSSCKGCQICFLEIVAVSDVGCFMANSYYGVHPVQRSCHLWKLEHQELDNHDKFAFRGDKKSECQERGWISFQHKKTTIINAIFHLKST